MWFILLMKHPVIDPGLLPTRLAPSLRVFSSLHSPSDDLLFILRLSFHLSFVFFTRFISFFFTFVLYLLSFFVLQVSVTNDADLQFILIEYLATDHSLLVIPPCLPAQKDSSRFVISS